MTSSRMKRTCAIAVVVSCFITVSLLPSKSTLQQGSNAEARKALSKASASGGAVRQLQDRESSRGDLLENKPHAASLKEGLQSQSLAEDRLVLPDSSAQKDQLNLKLRVHLKEAQALDTLRGRNDSHSSTHVPATLPIDTAQHQFVEDYSSVQKHVLAAGFVAQHAAAVQSQRSREQAEKRKPSQGIVIAAGKSLRLANAYVTLTVLREHMQSSLPVEIWYSGPTEMDAATKAGLEATFANVTCIDALEVQQPSHHRPASSIGGYALKVFALYATSFEEALLLDCDSMPIIDPQDAFDSPEFRIPEPCIREMLIWSIYIDPPDSIKRFWLLMEECRRRHGSMFWPDLFGKGTERVPGVQPELYTLLGMQPPWVGHEADFMWAESGQVLLDRVRHRDMLEYLWFLNAHPDPVYKLAYGDKDTFLLAFMLADKFQQYFQVEEWTRLCLHQRPGDDLGKLEHVGIIHHNPEGSAAFLHRTSGGKLDPGSDGYFTVDFITQPLSPQRAYVLFEGAAEDGNYRYPRERFHPAGHASHAHEPFQVCFLSHTVGHAATCMDDGRADLPVPVILREQLSGTLGDSRLAAVLEASYRGFEELRSRLKQPGNTLLKDLAWLR